jgi:hypothetical protein
MLKKFFWVERRPSKLQKNIKIEKKTFFSNFLYKFCVFLKFLKSKIKEKLEFKEKKSHVELRKNL